MGLRGGKRPELHETRTNVDLNRTGEHAEVPASATQSPHPLAPAQCESCWRDVPYRHSQTKSRTEYDDLRAPPAPRAPKTLAMPVPPARSRPTPVLASPA